MSAAPDELLELELLLATAPNVELGAAGAVEKPDFVLLGDEAAAGLAVDVAAAVVAAATVVAAEPPERCEGAATAVEGSTSAPVPQGMAKPSGWEAFAGSVVLPSAPAMVKRVVQVRAETFAGEENW